jgi:hypothetical protein
LDDRTRRLLEKLMRSTRKTQSEVIREAIEALARAECSGTESTPYAAVKDLIGCARGGPADLSVDTGTKFAELLSERRRNREER